MNSVIDNLGVEILGEPADPSDPNHAKNLQKQEHMYYQQKNKLTDLFYKRYFMGGVETNKHIKAILGNVIPSKYYYPNFDFDKYVDEKAAQVIEEDRKPKSGPKSKLTPRQAAYFGRVEDPYYSENSNAKDRYGNYKYDGGKKTARRHRHRTTAVKRKHKGRKHTKKHSKKNKKY